MFSAPVCQSGNPLSFMPWGVVFHRSLKLFTRLSNFRTVALSPRSVCSWMFNLYVSPPVFFPWTMFSRRILVTELACARASSRCSVDKVRFLFSLN